MLEQRIQDDYKQAMKDRDPAKVSTLSFLRAQLKNVMIEKRQDKLDDADVVAVIKKQVKQRQDAIEQYDKGGRQDLAEKEKTELGILKSYLPEELTEEELAALVAQAVQEVGATGIKDMGQVMKAIMPKAAGRADNKLLSQMVKTALSEIS